MYFYTLLIKITRLKYNIMKITKKNSNKKKNWYKFINLKTNY